MSSQVYPKGNPKHKAHTFHLVMLGGQKALDFEALSGHDFTILYNGFTYLNKVAYGHSPFYIDKNGVPCRAVGSILRHALPADHPSHVGEWEKEKEGSSIRLIDAVSFSSKPGLRNEYARWAQQRDAEEKVHKMLREKRRLELLHANEEENAAMEVEKQRKIDADDDDSEEDDEEGVMQARRG